MNTDLALNKGGMLYGDGELGTVKSYAQIEQRHL